MNRTAEQDYILENLKIVGLNRIKDIILTSEREKREYGLRLCKNDTIKVTHMCIGTECDLELSHCKNGKQTVGSFHTHPTHKKGIANFLSDNDIYGEAVDKSKFACIGLVEGNVPKIKCYLPNYGMDKSLIDNRNNLKTQYGIKVREYNPSGGSVSELTPQKYEELSRIYYRFLLADKRLKVESGRAALKLMKEPDQGSSLTINL